MATQTWHYLMIFCISFSCYFITIFSPFVFDDNEAIVNNKDVLPTTPFLNLFHNDFWGSDLKSNESHKSYRPLTVLTYRIDYLLASGLNPVQFHFTNVTLYSILCCLSFSLYKIILKSEYYAFLTSILFTLHPIHTECVASIVGRADILSGIMFILSILIYVKSLKSNSPLGFALSSIIIGIGTLCKETAITAFGFCGIYDFLKKSPLKSGKNLKSFFYRMMRLMISALIILYYRLSVMNFEQPNFNERDNPAAFANNTFTKIMSYNYIYFLNALLLIWPQWLCFDWSMGCIPLITSYCDSRLVFVIYFWIFLIFSLYKIRKLGKNFTPVVLGVSLIVFPFLPASNLLFKVGFVIAERILLLPSLGFCILVVVGFDKLNLKSKEKLLLFVYLIFSLRTTGRNLEWLSEEKLYESGLEVCPTNAKVQYNIGKVYGDFNKHSLAKEKYKKAIELNPTYESPMNNLANILREEGNFLDAEVLLRKALKIKPNFAAAWMNLGIVLTNLNKTEEAEKCYLTAIKYRNKYPDCYYNLGNLYLDLNRLEEALVAWKKAVTQKPTQKAAWGNLLVLLDTMKQYDEVLRLGEIALVYNPNLASAHFNIANTLGKMRKFQQAERHFQQALDLDSTNPLYHSNFGVLYHRWEKYEKAKEMYQKALQLDPNMMTTRNNLIKVNAKLK